MKDIGLAEQNCRYMNIKKTKEFLRSVVALPLFAIMPMTGVVGTTASVAINNISSVIESSVITTPEDEIRKSHAKAIDDFFAKRNAPLEGYGMKLVLEAEKNDLPWNLLAAISIIESSGGIQACKKARNSVFGYGSCKMDFKSIDESIEIVSRRLGGDSKYYHSEMTVPQILKKYNSVIPNYTYKVTTVMSMIEDMK